MDILIKSFNRPYYLARCIQSIYDNVLDEKIAIKILDDGTPEKYLRKIKLNFPDVIILKSKFYIQKSEALEKGLDFEITDIPIDLWINAARDASEYFVLLEDDIWFTQKINLKETEEIAIEENIFFLKLFWLNNSKLIHGKTKKLNNFITLYDPIVFTKNPFLYRLIFGITRFGNRKFMKLFRLYSDERALNYYSIYGVAGAIFNKKYFLSLWDNHNFKVDENLQLRNAVSFWKKNKKVQFARTISEYVATGFSSSATNKSFNPGKFDIFTFNKLLNEAWLNNDFDVMDTIPNDLNSSKICKILSDHDNQSANVNDWKIWLTNFKKQFQEIGCNI